jgi:hypothetical protein
MNLAVDLCFTYRTVSGGDLLFTQLAEALPDGYWRAFPLLEGGSLDQALLPAIPHQAQMAAIDGDIRSIPVLVAHPRLARAVVQAARVESNAEWSRATSCAGEKCSTVNRLE